MTDAVAAKRLPSWPLRVIWPRHTSKLAARHFRRSAETVTHWLMEGLPAAQRAELADAIDAKLDAIAEEVDALRACRDALRLGNRV